MIIEQYELPVVGNELTNRAAEIERLAFIHENKVTKLASKQERLNARLTRLNEKAMVRSATAAKVRRIVNVAQDSHVWLWVGITFSLTHQSINPVSYAALIGGVR